MAVIGLVVHEHRVQAAAEALALARWLQAEGHEVRAALGQTVVPELEHLRCPDHELGAGLDLAVTLGGDGSMLRAVELIDGRDVPLLGVDFGQLGYLTEVDPADCTSAIERFLTGQHGIEERMMVRAGIAAHPTELAPTEQVAHALNEIVVERTDQSNTIRIAVAIDGDFFTTYAADGLIIASPTGSTAYAFSARGPIVEPTHRSMQLTPVSPHMLFDRTLIVGPDTELRLVIEGDRPAALSVDGRRIGVLADGDAVTCTASERVVRLVTFRPRDFHQVLKTKFGLNDR